MKFYIVDAFTEKIFGGNPAGVVILPEGADFPSDLLMIETAAELRYSETAFIKKLSKKEFQLRFFTPAAEVDLCGHATIGSFKALLYGGYIEDNCQYPVSYTHLRQLPAFVLAVEVCEDLWAALPPSTFHTLAGATVIANPSASDEIIGKSQYRKDLVCGQAARMICGYVYSTSGHGESTTDMTFSGNNLIAEDGAVVSEAKPFGDGFCDGELDVEKLQSERMKNTTFEPLSAATADYTEIS